MNRRQLLQAGLGTIVGAASGRLVATPGPATVVGAVAAEMINGGTTIIPSAALKDLRKALGGVLLLPADAGYDEARQLVNRFDRRPAFIVRAAGTDDVRRAVDFARDNGLLMSVKGGGHSDWGVSSRDGAMMLDLSLIQGTRLDAANRRITVGGATHSGQIDIATAPHGLAVPLGGMPTVGIGGLATGGGIGKLSRRFGLTLDSIRSLDIVTADGRLLHASAEQEPDLFWAVRGGGGNFGVVTRFELELHPISPHVIYGNIQFPFAQARQVLRGYGDICANAPDELYVECFIGVRENIDQSILQLGVCYSGDPSKADAQLAFLLKLGTVLKNDVADVEYVAAQRANVPRSGRIASAHLPAVYFRSGFLGGRFTNGLAWSITENIVPDTGRTVNMLFLHMGGAIARVKEDSTAFANRAGTHDMLFVCSPKSIADADRHLAYADELWGHLRPHTSGFYVNDMAGGATPEAVAANYRYNFPRLAALKARYDPADFFRLNANIRPELA